MKNIVHFKYGKYLPATQNWIYPLLSNLEKYLPLVYCFGTSNLDTYKIKKIRSFGSLYFSQNPVLKLFSYVYNRLLFINPLIFASFVLDKPLLVHAHFGESGLAVLPWVRILRIPLITSFYGVDLNDKYKNMYQKLFQRGTCFFAMGRAMKKKLVFLGCPRRKIIIYHLGIELEKIPYLPRKLLRNQSINILLASRFTPKKGLPDAIEAVGILHKNYPLLKIKLSIIGDTSNTKEDIMVKKVIISKIKKYSLESSTFFLGKMSHGEFIQELYNNHLFLSPSVTANNGDNEGGYNMAVLEASVSGMPVISTLHCDIPDTIIDGKSGYLVPEHRPDLIAKKLDVLISNQNSWPEMGLAGRKHVEKNYNAISQTRLLENLYDKILTKNQTKSSIFSASK